MEQDRLRDLALLSMTKEKLKIINFGDIIDKIAL